MKKIISTSPITNLFSSRLMLTTLYPWILFHSVLLFSIECLNVDIHLALHALIHFSIKNNSFSRNFHLRVVDLFATILTLITLILYFRRQENNKFIFFSPASMCSYLYICATQFKSGHTQVNNIEGHRA